MPTTPIYSLRYPENNTAPNVPLDLQKLAEDTEAALTDTSATITGAWMDITRGSGLTALDAVDPQVRWALNNAAIQLRGGVYTSGGTSAGQILATLPSTMWPPINRNLVVATSAGPLSMTIFTSGGMVLSRNGVLPANSWADFSGLIFSL